MSEPPAILKAVRELRYAMMREGRNVDGLAITLPWESYNGVVDQLMHFYAPFVYCTSDPSDSSDNFLLMGVRIRQGERDEPFPK